MLQSCKKADSVDWEYPSAWKGIMQREDYTKAG